MTTAAKVQAGTYHFIAPAGTQDVFPKHRGRLLRHPEDYTVSVCIPHLNTPEPLKLVVELLRLQTERPYIMVVDTGSSPAIIGELEAMRDVDLEIHYIAGNGWRHSSEPVTAALDLAHSRCQTRYLYHTHADCFLRRRDFLEFLLQVCHANTPAVGYRMSPRDWIPGADDWEWMVGHVALMLYMPSIHRVGATWSMARAVHAGWIPWHIDGGWPDTECGFNYCLREAGIKPVFIGHDDNYTREIDSNRDHPRSFSGSKLYAPEYHQKAEEWMQEAIKEARERIELWRSSPL